MYRTTFLLLVTLVVSAPTILSAQPARTINGLATTSSPSGYGFLSTSKEQRELEEMIRKEAINFRQAGDKGSRERAEANLYDLLSKDYDDRLQGYEDNLNRLEEELKAMRDKLRKRREAKDDMIRLRIKVLEAEADDLGWPERARRSSISRSLFNKEQAKSRTRWSQSGNFPAIRNRPKTTSAEKADVDESGRDSAISKSTFICSHEFGRPGK